MSTAKVAPLHLRIALILVRALSSACTGAVAIASFFALVVSSPAIANIAVSSSGQATSGHAIAVPPGIAGMVPNLSLSYSDGGINGPVGVGWSVQGISAITRCPASRAVDGVPRGVEFAPSDKLCLDGQRLIQTNAQGDPAGISQVNDANGLTGGAVREYRTEKDSFARIRAYESASGNLANGPAYFKVWTKSGQLYEYGQTPNGSDMNSQVKVQGGSIVAVWAVRRISDVVGNYIDFRYEQRDVAWGSGTSSGVKLGHEWNLAEVQYTGTASQVPHNKVVFVYEDRWTSGSGEGADRAEAYQWDNKNVSVRRLAAVRSYVNSPSATPASVGAAPGAVPVRTLKLAYGNSPVTGRSRLTQITECAGSSDSLCLPPTQYAYRDTDAVQFTKSTAFEGGGLNRLRMLDATAQNGNLTYGVITGDFNGDGRTDILRWGNSSSDNQLWLSQGNGEFIQSTAFNQTSTNLFITGGCYWSIVADFNGDGLSDILRGAPCGTDGGNKLLLSAGDGTFTTVLLDSVIDLSAVRAIYNTEGSNCYARGMPDQQAYAHAALTRFSNRAQNKSGLAGADAVARIDRGPAAKPPECWENRSLGKRFYVLDVNGDGYPDIVTTVAPNYHWNVAANGGVPDEDALCNGQGTPAFAGPCSRVFLGSASGQFTERTITNIAHRSLYSDPSSSSYVSNPYWRLPDQADINGDGLQDILSELTGRWRSLGNGDFDPVQIADPSQLCGLPIDFNGDGRSDCLYPDSSYAAQRLTLSYKTTSSSSITQFNLNTLGHNLFAVDGTNGGQSVGAVVDDFDGDGRQDILRWGPSLTIDNRIYLSNGDGSFRVHQPSIFANLPTALQKSDGTRSFVLGDFLGIGATQILHLKSNPPQSGGTEADTNQLYVRSGNVGPADVLVSVTSPTGLVSSVDSRVPLTQERSAGGSYVSDRGVSGLAAQAPMLDLRPPMYVIASTTRQTGSGPLTTGYLYKGLKAEVGAQGRGLLGFREVQQQDATPNGVKSLTVATEYLLKHPYNGVAWRSRTFLAALDALGGTPLSTTLNTYCDKTSATAPTAATEQAPCATTAKVSRPYLRRSIETGTDLNAAVLPTVTTVNIYNDFGDPLQIVVSTEAPVAGAVRTYTKTTTNEFCDPGSTLPGGAACPNRTAGDDWILGRLTRASVLSQSPNLLPALTAGAGTSPTATATTGSPPPGSPQLINPAVLSVILQLLLED